ncbi:RHS repeat-associated core domain-containing protein [Nonomuraea sp. NPDC003709]|uniref:RHS repeat-associated core domain-containing protein n=1 Tax=Nonomuraea sp. NPDC003709 TaxID=3154450 RepID=UPI0033A28040
MVVDDDVTYDYDALDRVETRTRAGKTERMTNDGASNSLVTVTDAATGAKTAMFGHDALGRTLGLSDGAGAQLAFCDLRGDLVGTFTATGTSLADSVAYNPFGEVVTRTGAAHTLGYQGGYTDPVSGKVSMAARWYQPTTGGFVSGDTLTQSPDPSVQLNRYAYANDNPLTNIDPDGHKSWDGLKGKKKSACVDGENKKDYNRCRTDYGKSGCKEAEGWYKSCRLGGGKQKDCQEQKDVFGDCRADTSADRSACVDSSRRYDSCRNGGDSRKLCRDISDKYTDCRGVKGLDHSKCTWANEDYSDCRKSGDRAQDCNKAYEREVDCLGTRKKSNAGDVCGGAGEVFLGCRREKVDTASCESRADVYSICRDVGADDARCDNRADAYGTCRKKGGKETACSQSVLSSVVKDQDLKDALGFLPVHIIAKVLGVDTVQEIEDIVMAYAKLKGAKCDDLYRMMVCSGAQLPGLPKDRSGVTIGRVYFTPEKDRSKISAGLIEHEKVHTKQRYYYYALTGNPLAFAVAYAKEGQDPCQNGFEAEAGWERGGYSQCL